MRETVGLGWMKLWLRPVEVVGDWKDGWVCPLTLVELVVVEKLWPRWPMYHPYEEVER